MADKLTPEPATPQNRGCCPLNQKPKVKVEKPFAPAGVKGTRWVSARLGRGLVSPLNEVSSDLERSHPRDSRAQARSSENQALSPRPEKVGRRLGLARKGGHLPVKLTLSDPLPASLSAVPLASLGAHVPPRRPRHPPRLLTGQGVVFPAGRAGCLRLTKATFPARTLEWGQHVVGSQLR